MSIMLKKSVEPYKGFPSYYAWLANDYKERRDILFSILNASTKFSGKCTNVLSGYFMISEIDMTFLNTEKY